MIFHPSSLSILIFGAAIFPSSTHSYTIITLNEDNNNLLGNEKCTWGPSYWCRNLTHSTTCPHSTHYCIDKIWPNLHPPQDDDPVCKVCLDMVTQARDQLLSNETQDELKEVLEGSCNLIPLKIISKECCNLMDNFMPELVDALVSRMDPQTVCTVSGLCNNDRIDEMLRKEQKLRISCPTCTKYMDDLFQTIRSDTNVLKSTLLNECGHLGSYSDSCKKAVEENIQEIEKLLEKINGKEFCEVVGICSEGQEQETSSMDDLECSFCTHMVDYLRNWLTLNTTKEEFDQVLKGLCKATRKEQECEEFVEKYGGQVYRVILDDLDAESFCERVGICGNGTASPLWTLLSPSNSPKMAQLTPAEPITPQTTPTCHLCTLISEKLEQYLASPTTEHSAEEFVDKLCSRYLPKNMAGQCQEFVTEYGTDLMELIEQEVEPRELCPALNLCLAKLSILPTCPLCTFTVTKLIDLIGRNHTKESIEAATEAVCHMLPSRMLQECESFMKNYGDKVVEMILIDGSAHEICAAVGLCLPVGKVEFKVIKDDDPKCVLCEYVITTLAQRIKNNATEEEIKEELDRVCERMPKSVTKKCEEFVAEYGDLVISYLIQEMDPVGLCTEIHLCKKAVTQCTLCHTLVDHISRSGTGYCDNQDCIAMMEDYGGYLEQLVREGNKEDACGVVQLC